LNIKSPTRTRETLSKWIAEKRYTTFVTLTFNPNKKSGNGTSMSLLPGGMKSATKTLKDWDACLNRNAIGPKWLTKKGYQRLVGIAFAENIATNFHWHIVCTPPIPKLSYCDSLYTREKDDNLTEENMSTEEFAQLVDVRWREKCYNGTTKTVPIHDHHRLADYITKQCYRRENYDGFVTLGPRLS
jgi:hypothetical protein